MAKKVKNRFSILEKVKYREIWRNRNMNMFFFKLLFPYMYYSMHFNHEIFAQCITKLQRKIQIFRVLQLLFCSLKFCFV